MKLLSHILIADFNVSADAVTQAMQDIVVYGGSLGTNLLEMGLVSEEVLLQALAKRYGTPAIDLRALEIHPRALETLPMTFVQKHKVLPLRIRGKTLDLLMSNPLDRVALAEVSMASGTIIKPYVVVESRLEELLQEFAGIAKGWRYRENPNDKVTKRRSVAPQSFHEAKALLGAAANREDVGDALLSFLIKQFRRVVLFVYRREILIAWRGARHSSASSQQPGPLGEPNLDHVALQSLYLPLHRPSAFKTAVETGAPSIGSLQPNKTHDFFYSVLGGSSLPHNAFLAPVMVHNRAVNVVYGDNGPAESISANLTDVTLCLSSAAEAYERLIREKLKRDVQ